MHDKNSTTLIHRFLHWERTQPDAVYLTQPYPDGRVEDYAWEEVGSQARRMAAYLQSLQLPLQSNIAILGKNSAHWIMADLAIWMAGHVSVPLYPTMNADTAQHIFEHSSTQLLFVGKLDGKTDGWNEIRKVLPANMPVIGLPMSPTMDAPTWDALIADAEPLRDVHLPGPGDLATIVYTSGTTGKPKGVMHSFGGIFTYAVWAGNFNGFGPGDRVLSYLPLAHTASDPSSNRTRFATAATSISTTAWRHSHRICGAPARRFSSPCRDSGPSSISASAPSCRRANRNCCSRCRSSRRSSRKRSSRCWGLKRSGWPTPGRRRCP